MYHDPDTRTTELPDDHPQLQSVDTSRWKRFIRWLVHTIDCLIGSPEASAGDMVFFTDPDLVTDLGSRSGVVHRVCSPNEPGEGDIWWYLVEPTGRPEELRHIDSDTDIAEANWLHWYSSDVISGDPADAPSGRAIAASAQRDFIGIIPVTELDSHVEMALDDILSPLGFSASVTFNRDTQSYTASLSLGPASTTTDSPRDISPATLAAATSPSTSSSSVDADPTGASDADVREAVDDVDVDVTFDDSSSTRPSDAGPEPVDAPVPAFDPDTGDPDTAGAGTADSNADSNTDVDDVHFPSTSGDSAASNGANGSVDSLSVDLNTTSEASDDAASPEPASSTLGDLPSENESPPAYDPDDLL